MRFNKLSAASIGLLALAASGCASSQSAGSSSVAADAASGKLGPAMLQWSGNFRPTQQQTSSISMRGRNQASGTVLLTAPNTTQMRVQITASLPVTDPVRLPWAIASGPCGSNAIPLLTVPQFPAIPVSNGQASLDEMLSLALPTVGTYHVDVFNYGTSGSEESDVLACANLSIGRRGS